jgi:hypothetical protein
MAILGYKNNTRAHPIRAFGMAEWLETRGLAGWLEIATDGLEASAQQRIANEIGVHYAEAVSAHLAPGETELSAQATALADLGDPQEAALNFRKSHLTEFEAKSLNWMERTAGKPLFSIRALLLDVIPVVGLVLLLSRVRWISRPLLESHFFAGLVIVAYAGFRLIPRLLCAGNRPRYSFFRGLALSYFMTTVAITLNLALIIYMQDQNFLSAFDAFFICFLYGYRLNPGFQIWIKLRKMGDEQKDLPPCPTPAS